MQLVIGDGGTIHRDRVHVAPAKPAGNGLDRPLGGAAWLAAPNFPERVNYCR